MADKKYTIVRNVGPGTEGIELVILEKGFWCRLFPNGNYSFDKLERTQVTQWFELAGWTTKGFDIDPLDWTPVMTAHEATQEEMLTVLNRFLSGYRPPLPTTAEGVFTAEELKRIFPGYSPTEDLFKQGQGFEQIGALSAAREMYEQSEDEKLTEIVKQFAQKKPIGRDLDDVKKYEESANRAQQAGIQTSRPKPLQPGDRGLDFDSCIIEKKPDVTFEDVVGNEEAKKALQEALVFPKERPELFPLGFPSTILFYGPPGCGKTHLAAAVANEIKADFLIVDTAAIMTRWVGESEQNVRKLFDEARRRAEQGRPVIIFMDELEDMLNKEFRHEADRKVRNQFQREIDGIKGKGEAMLPIYVIGATNKPWELNDAMASRFEKRIYIDLPDKNDRIELFRMYMGYLSPVFEIDEKVNFEVLAEKSDGYSARDIKNMCKDIQNMIVRDMYEKGLWEKTDKPRKITMEDCSEAVNRRKPSATREDIKEHIKWAEEHKAE